MLYNRAFGGVFFHSFLRRIQLCSLGCCHSFFLLSFLANLSRFSPVNSSTASRVIAITTSAPPRPTYYTLLKCFRLLARVPFKRQFQSFIPSRALLLFTFSFEDIRRRFCQGSKMSATMDPLTALVEQIENEHDESRQIELATQFKTLYDETESLKAMLQRVPIQVFIGQHFHKDTIDKMTGFPIFRALWDPAKRGVPMPATAAAFDVPRNVICFVFSPAGLTRTTMESIKEAMTRSPQDVISLSNICRLWGGIYAGVPAKDSEADHQKVFKEVFLQHK